VYGLEQGGTEWCMYGFRQRGTHGGGIFLCLLSLHKLGFRQGS
jgi:hypothetical protein